MAKVIVVVGSCPLCGHTGPGKVEKVTDKTFKGHCPTHAIKDFKILSAKIVNENEAEAWMRGEVI